MELFKKIVAGIVMVLSVVAVIALVVGLFASWAVKARMETVSIDLLLAGENVVETTRDGLARIDEILYTSSELVNDVDAKVTEIGEGVKESDPLFVQLLDSIGVDLKSTLDNAADSFSQIEANVVAINDAVEAFTAIPLLGVQDRMPSVTKLQQVESQMAALREDVATLTQEVQEGREEIISGKFGRVTDVTGGMRDNLDITRSDLIESDARLAESATTMAELRDRIPGLYTTITIILNLLMLLAILAFISLFLHSWQYFKCPDDGLGGLMPGECDKAPATA